MLAERRISERCLRKKEDQKAVEGGGRQLAYLALRLALMGQIYLLDEALCQIDDGRARRALSLLAAGCADGLQILLFTCHTRENSLCRVLDIPAHTVSMTEE